MSRQRRQTPGQVHVVQGASEKPPQPSERPSWQRPPFQPGHELSMKHGARSERAIQRRVPEELEVIREAIRAERGYVSEGDDVIAQRMAHTASKLRLLDEYEARIAAEWEDDGSAAAMSALLAAQDKHGEKKGRAENLLLKQTWSLGLGRMASARVYEAISGGGRRDDGSWREAQQRLREKYG